MCFSTEKLHLRANAPLSSSTYLPFLLFPSGTQEYTQYFRARQIPGHHDDWKLHPGAWSFSSLFPGVSNSICPIPQTCSSGRRAADCRPHSQLVHGRAIDVLPEPRASGVLCDCCIFRKQLITERGKGPITVSIYFVISFV